jgi:alpha-N-acetylglucosamine transferase
VNIQALTAKNLSGVAGQQSFKPPTMSDWIPMEWARGADSSWMRSPLNRDDATTRQTSWKDTARKLVGVRAIHRVLLACLLIFMVTNLFRLRVPLGFIPFGAISSDQLLDGVDWSQCAYCQYVTSPRYLYNSVMIFEALDGVGAKASKVLMYPSNWNITSDNEKRRLIRQAQDSYNVQLLPIQVQHFSTDKTWADSFTKLLAFNQTKFKRVLSLDSDATVLKSMDELFLVPSAPVAMPRAYWLEHTLSSQLVLVEPSEFEFQRILEAFNSRASADFDMEIVNNLYGSNCMVIPHRKYDPLTDEFRAKEHRKYLGSEEET